jgi:two-component system, sensor histidine kinase RegB
MPANDRSQYGLTWLIRIRWLAVLGQAATCAVVGGILDVRLPYLPLLCCLLLTLAGNTLLVVFRSRLPWSAEAWCFGLLSLDTLTLTAMLFMTGGAHNPFSTFYLLHVGLAAILLDSAGVWFILIISSLGFLLLFSSPFALQCHAGGDNPMPFDLHLQGMLVALALCGGLLAYFVGRLRNDFQKLDEALATERERSLQSRHITALATLAAGVAHELATPIGTIAVAGKEMEKQARSQCQNTECLEDAILICRQVERCQNILHRLNLDSLRAQSHNSTCTPTGTLPGLLLKSLPPDQTSRVRFSGFDHSAAFNGSQSLLLQSLDILINNALAASPPGLPVEVGLDVADNALSFIVRDRGNGMDPETLKRAGEPFYTTKQAGEGLGLGLFLVRMFCESAGGHLGISSTPGGGTTATLMLPAANPDTGP